MTVADAHTYLNAQFRQQHGSLINAIQRGDADLAYYLTKQVYRLVVR